MFPWWEQAKGNSSKEVEYEVLKGNLGMPDTSLIPSRESVFLPRAPSVAVVSSTSLLAYMPWLLEFH